jgi:polyisoprenyl-teichoic acid--peptidoglycan teichoic acid transferase
MQLTRSHALFNRVKRQIFSHVGLVRIILLLVVIFGLIAAWVLLRQPALTITQNLVTASQLQLPSHDGRTNFLLLGIGGGTHDGPDLTDSIIFASVRQDTGETVFISIPRDLWVPSLRDRINSAYAYGKGKDGASGGLILAKSSVSEVIHQPIDFTAVVDFSTFARAIDMLGGVDVNVEHSFDDFYYPVAGKENDTCGLSLTDAATQAAAIVDDASAAVAFPCRYEHLHFDAGFQHMDGSMALKFVRSRHATGDEGSDFARSRRQEALLNSIKAKLVSKDVLSRPQTYKELYDLITKSITTDLKPDLYPAFTKLALKAKQHPFRSFIISEPDQVYNPPISAQYDLKWILLPKNNDPQVIFDFVAGRLVSATPSSTPGK